MNRFLRIIALKLQSLFQGHSRQVYNISENLAIPSDDHPVFIVGAPRTGSTLIFQDLIQHFRIAYISNLMALLPKYIVPLFEFSRRRILSHSGIRPSHFG